MKKKNKYIDQAKSTMGLGVVSMGGMGVMGAMGSIHGMPSSAGTLTSTVGAGLNLANVGNLANIGMNIMPNTASKKSKITDPRLRKMLGK